jgi:hypothetical protein
MSDCKINETSKKVPDTEISLMCETLGMLSAKLLDRSGLLLKKIKPILSDCVPLKCDAEEEKRDIKTEFGAFLYEQISNLRTLLSNLEDMSDRVEL